MDGASLNWVPHRHKHFPPENVEWSVLVEQTKSCPAFYHPDFKIEKEERRVATDGIELSKPDDEYRFFYAIYPAMIVGASEGKETDIVRVQVNPDLTLHGKPVSERELKLELKALGLKAQLTYQRCRAKAALRKLLRRRNK